MQETPTDAKNRIATCRRRETTRRERNIDLFSRKVVGWAMSDSLATPLVAAALRRAIESRRPAGGELLHHSDRGCQYASDAYQRTLKALGIACSMSRTGECYDNAVAERFFWSLKHERIKHE